MADARTPAQRKADTLRILAGRDLDAWVATASPTAGPHLVPLSLAWDGRLLTLALEPSAVTTRNIVDGTRARVAVGGSRDVVMIDAVLEHAWAAEAAPEPVVDAYVEQAGWDPRVAGTPFMVVQLRPGRIQAWREVNEIADRTLMRDGRWLTD